MAPQMHNFGEFDNASGMPAVFQPGAHIDAQMLEGRLVVKVDCYSKLWPDEASSPAFDVEAWDRHQLCVESMPGADLKVAWKEAFGLARALLNGRRVQVGTHPDFDIREWAEAVAAAAGDGDA